MWQNRRGGRAPAPGRASPPCETRVCYDHLAGSHAVDMLSSLTARGIFAEDGEDLILTDDGTVLFETFGINLAALRRSRRPLCRSCLDWSERRFHLGGSLGAAVLTILYDRGWAKREDGTRVVRFTNSGLTSFRETFALDR